MPNTKTTFIVEYGRDILLLKLDRKSTLDVIQLMLHNLGKELDHGFGGEFYISLSGTYIE